MLPVAALGAMRGAAAPSGLDPVSDARLRPAAHQFEACLMKEFLEPLQHDALFADDKRDGSGDDSGSALTSFGSDALARAISERGGFGIADEIVRHLEKGTPAAGAANSENSLKFRRNGGLKF